VSREEGEEFALRRSGTEGWHFLIYIPTNRAYVFLSEEL
jgi:hypothetical protein